MSTAPTDAREFGRGLNSAQLRAATFGAPRRDASHLGGVRAGPLLIIAGAGTGKTNTLAHRVAYLLLNGVAPQRIALLTFTRRASQEMLQRAERIASAELRGARGSRALETRALWSGTFHSVGNRLLREYAAVLGIDASFSVIDRGDAADLIDLQRHELGFSKLDKRFPRKDTCLAIYSHRVNSRGTLLQSLEANFPWCAEWRDELTQLFRGYVQAKQKQQLLDYDDLLLYWHVLAQEPAMARELGDRFDHVLVDEYQDTNTLQAEILLAMKPTGAGLCVVGDDGQSIYSFRAASVENILQFPTRFAPPADIVTLERNYRSLQPILDTANVLMAESTRQYQKRLTSEKPSGQKPWYVTVEDDRNQSLYVVEQILEKREQGVALRHQAVLMRSAHHSDALEVELVRRNIPYVKYGGLKFLEAAHVKDLLALLRWIDNPRNRLAAFRSLQLLPGIGPSIAGRCLDALDDAGFDFAALAQCRVPAATDTEWRPFVQLLCETHVAPQWAGQMTRIRQWYEPHLQRMYDAANVRMGDLEQLELIATQFPSRERFITELTLDPPNATGDESGAPHKDEDYLILSTVHSAKGQEWDSVFILNVTDGSFPSEFATDNPQQIEEERRLLYVGITRAKNDVHLLAPAQVLRQPATPLGGKARLRCAQPFHDRYRARDGRTTRLAAARRSRSVASSSPVDPHRCGRAIAAHVGRLTAAAALQRDVAQTVRFRTVAQPSVGLSDAGSNFRPSFTSLVDRSELTRFLCQRVIQDHRIARPMAMPSTRSSAHQARLGEATWTRRCRRFRKLEPRLRATDSYRPSPN